MMVDSECTQRSQIKYREWLGWWGLRYVYFNTIEMSVSD